MGNKVGSSTVGGIGFAGLLTIIFIALKLFHVINWSWLWVLLIWIGWALILAGFIIFAIWFWKR